MRIFAHHPTHLYFISFLFFFLSLATLFYRPASAYRLEILHTNDQHAHFAPFTRFGTFCNESALSSYSSHSVRTRGQEQCIGGVARRAQLIQEIRAQNTAAGIPTLLLDSGDIFQGTLFFNLYRGNASALLMNALAYDVFTVGNHEFDDGLPTLFRFLSSVQFPVVCANLHMQPALPPYVVLRNTSTGPLPQPVAILGVVTEDLPRIALLPKGVTVSNIVTTLQPLVDQLRYELNVSLILLLSHAGIDRDREVAAQTSGISMILGGHSHTYMPAPEAIRNAAGSVTWVYQDWEWGRQLGHLSLDVNEDSLQVQVQVQGGPVPMDEAHVPGEQPQIASLVHDLERPLQALMAQKKGSAQGTLDGETCRYQECSLGNVVTRAICTSPLIPSSSSSLPVVSFVNGGTIRASLHDEITLGDIYTVFPFGDSYVGLEISEPDLWRALAYGVSKRGMGAFPQLSENLRVEIESMSGSWKLSSLRVGSSVQLHAENEADPERWYLLVISGYMVNGGDGYGFVADSARRRLDYGYTLSDIMSDYVSRNSPLLPAVDGRISFQSEPIHPPSDGDTSKESDQARTWEAWGVWIGVGAALGLLVVAVAVWRLRVWWKSRVPVVRQYGAMVDDGNVWDDRVDNI